MKFYMASRLSEIDNNILKLLLGSEGKMATHEISLEHDDVAALWYVGSAKTGEMVERESAGNLKATWVNHGKRRNWFDDHQAQGWEYLRHAVQIRREGRGKGLALARLHLGDPAEVQRRPAHELDVEVSLADRPLGPLAYDRERLDQQVVELLAVGKHDGHRRAALHLLDPIKILRMGLFRRGGLLVRLRAAGRTRNVMFLHFG